VKEATTFSVSAEAGMADSAIKAGIAAERSSLCDVIEVSNERTQGAEHHHLAAFPWVRLSFDRHSHRSAKSLFPPDRSLCCPSVLEPVSNA
jgi:hypothetical protein